MNHHLTPAGRVPDLFALDGEIRLRRRDAAAALSAAGFPVAPSTLATQAVRSGGPPFQRFGRTPLYLIRDLRAWVERKLSPAVSSTSEIDALGGGKVASLPWRSRPTPTEPPAA
jgi:hypothetical protein